MVRTADVKLECLHTWKVNDTRYLIARVVGDHSGLANCFVRIIALIIYTDNVKQHSVP